MFNESMKPKNLFFKVVGPKIFIPELYQDILANVLLDWMVTMMDDDDDVVDVLGDSLIISSQNINRLVHTLFIKRDMSTLSHGQL